MSSKAELFVMRRRSLFMLIDEDAYRGERLESGGGRKLGMGDRQSLRGVLKSVSLTMEQERSVVSHGSGILNTTYRIEASTAIGAEKRMPMRRGEG